jgi:hypothetical protein
MPNVVVAEGNDLPFSLITWGMCLDTPPTLCEVFEGKREEETEALAEEDGWDGRIRTIWFITLQIKDLISYKNAICPFLCP